MTDELRPPADTPDGALFYLRQPLDGRRIPARWSEDDSGCWEFVDTLGGAHPEEMAGWSIVCRIPDAADLLRQEARVTELLEANNALVEDNHRQHGVIVALDARVTAFSDAIGSMHAEKVREVDAARARARAASEATAPLVRMLAECRRVFLLYADLHRAKGTPEAIEKAERNAGLAERCKEALRATEGVL